jgi:hypothetical protein
MPLAALFDRPDAAILSFFNRPDAAGRCNPATLELRAR